MKRKAILVALVFCLLISAMPSSAFAEETPGSTSEESESYIIANIEMGEETQRVLSLLEGPVGSYYFFSYQTDASYSAVKLCYDTYVDGKKEEETVVLDFAFAETPYAEPRRGDLFISTTHCYTTLNETYYKDVEVWDKDGAVIDVLHHRELTRWDTCAFLPAGDTFIAPAYQVCFPTEEAATVEKGISVNLMLMVESGESENWFRKTAQELLDAPELLGGSRFYVFYCIFT